MELRDYHTHHERCNHAKGKIIEYIESAIEKGVSEIGITDHFPMKNLLPEEANVWKYSMEPEEFPKYLKEAETLREKFKGKIKVLVGSEVDYYPDSFLQYKEKVTPFLNQMDYIIGSIHVIKIKEHAWAIDDDDNEQGMVKYGPDNVYIAYYQQLKMMVETGFYDIVGHCDLPKKYGIRADHPEKVWKYVLEYLDTVEKSDMAVEINASGLYKPIGEQYPADPIIEELIRRKIPITLGSDSHVPENIGYEFEKIIKKVKKMGLTQLCKIEKRNKTLTPI